MSKIKEKSLKGRLKSIRRGAYWFEMIGRLSIVLGILRLVTALGFLLLGRYPLEESIDKSIEAIALLIFGWLFLLGHNAFEAIASLIEERPVKGAE